MQVCITIQKYISILLRQMSEKAHHHKNKITITLDSDKLQAKHHHKHSK